MKFRSGKFEGRNVKFRSEKYKGGNIEGRNLKIRSFQCAIGMALTGHRTKHTLKNTHLYRCNAESKAVVAVIPASSGSYTGGDQYIPLTDVTPIPILRF